MQQIGLLKNTIQEYAWGSTQAIPDLLGQRNPGNKPQAELWMGAHPKAPSLVQYHGQWVSLLDLINKNPVEVLGKNAAKNFNNKLPYLFKVLAAAKPLSIQAHPNVYQAREGFERENAQGIPLNAPYRNYRDAHHKPECICALTPFWALSRFRRISGILSYLKKVCAHGLDAEINNLKQQPTSDGLKGFYTDLMTMDADRQNRIAAQALEQAQRFEAQDPVFSWMLKIAADYPNDIGVLAPILLNLICLEPGQALFLDAGEFHAYLEGLGIELMANSDNVLRGGLTPKHVDVPELLRVLKFEDQDVFFLKPQEVVPNEFVYPSPAKEFELSVITLNSGAQYQSPAQRSVEILICTRGIVTLTDYGNQTETQLQQGVSALIPAAVERYAIKGEGTCYKAAVPI
ncbi:MAG: mannose-6-phosphate isomerase, class I [Desulfobacterales bacterium]|jgi:mannose-6-phosphate isomerase|nr:mannose-6-phosphate isomerase, class I [Desulfobacterales bacterium]